MCRSRLAPTALTLASQAFSSGSRLSIFSIRPSTRPTLLMLHPPSREPRVRPAHLALEAPVQARVLDLLVGLELGLQLGPESAPRLGRRLQHLLERGLGLLVLLLQELDRIHGSLLGPYLRKERALPSRRGEASPGEK
jgi:hypothetical protein